MRILQILPELNVGGVERGTVDFAKYLVERGHGSVVVSNGGSLVESLEQSGSKHYSFPVHRKNLWVMFRMVKVLRSIIIKEKIDVVHARSRVPAWIAYFACRRTEAVFITTCHGHYKNRLFSQVMGWSKLVIVPSHSVGQFMMRNYGVSSKSLRYIPRSVDRDYFAARPTPARNESKCIISIVGRITPLKGHKFFLRAMVKVIRNIPFAKIWIIGESPQKKPGYRKELELLVRHLGIERNVEFLGNRKDIPELLAKTDVLVMSSIEPESFGRVILEGQAVGVPVIATKVGGVVDIIDHEVNGLLVAPKDVEAMANQVIRVIKNKDIADTLVRNAKEKIKNNFLLEHMAEKTIAVYEELLKSTNILVIKLSSIGDVILSTASLRSIRSKLSQAKIYCLVGSDSRKVLHKCPYIDGMIIYDQKKDKGITGLLHFSRRLRKYRFDKIVDLQNNRTSHILSFLSFPKESYGYDNGKWGFLLANAIKNVKQNIPPVEHQFQVLKMLGIKYTEEQSYLELWPSPKDDLYVQELLDSEWLGNARYIVGVNISASANWPTKNWPLEYIAELANELSKKNVRILITGSEKDIAWARHLQSMVKTKLAVFTGKTDIMQLAGLIKRCSLYLTPDSAPLHVASAVGTKTIAFFGPTASRRHSPPDKNTLKIFEKKLTCTPCYSGKCKILTHACMREIKPSEVLECVYELLEIKK
ncbi:MAG: GT4 family glycosyltransferase PelF [Candidatus Omnitrophica bacterium]|nr:GT4 family glycosyltransferase PelF [Candidatus Omnitrophota bacterium]